MGESKQLNQDALTALLEEYRAMYQLAVFRMSALDRRAPVTAGVFAVALASMQALPVESQLMVLVATPPALVWLMRTTVNHARSFEDVLRRIEVIEGMVNERIGTQFLGFQSSHPSRGKYVGGRTGRESVIAVFGSIMLLLLAAGYQLHIALAPHAGLELLYGVFLASVASLAIRDIVKLSRYRYAAPGEALPGNLPM